MNEILNIQSGSTINVIKIVTSSGPTIDRPNKTFKKTDVFTPRIFKSGNSVYTCNTFSMNVPVDKSMAIIDFAEHMNGAVFKISYNNVNFVAPSLYPISGLGTNAVFDLHTGEIAQQRKITELGNRDVRVADEISDVAADDRSILITTKLVSERTPGELSRDVVLNEEIIAGKINLNTGFVSDVVHTKKISIVDDGIVDYYVKINIPAKHSHGIVEVVAGTFLSDIMIHLVRNKNTWKLMGDKMYDANVTNGIVFAKDPDTSMGISLIDWPRGAIMFPPKYNFKKFKNVNTWSISQQIGSMVNTSVKIPGGEYSWKIRLFFGPIWQVQQHINSVETIPHGNEYKILYKDEVAKYKFQKISKRNFHEYDYDYTF
ncbi:hypothetical protein NY2A_B385R [Paramecium bursaria Chlorella virus NY2A]|uniref:Uncharacterized protein B385R n=1 Tax=Paramecium bursaria Chlorella virus NY2A TaxID=46021 RepID=A7IWR0_PBCVN|nr:hypothetical protein NY2A_B385R [Paramecium bursaria Chlorella virus NY2A]ABT14784.1 hypothetical protein NY2A_B385R [Paramecium bursaria Chlorella virus NY2A]